MTTNEFLNCPRCRGQIVNDDRLAGKVVACPHCRSPIQMPAAASDFFAELAATHRKPVNIPRKKPRPIDGKVLAFVGGVLLLLIGLAIAVTITAVNDSNDQKAKQAAADPHDPWNLGFHHGYEGAAITRTYEGATGEVRTFDADYHGSFRYDDPAKMGRFRDGYRAGYKKGWNEH
jgi:hypothetical protein